MGEAKRKKAALENWPDAESYRGTIDLHVLPPAKGIDGALIRELTGDYTLPDAMAVILRAFKAVVGGREFHVGFCLGSGEEFSAIGVAVMERLAMEAPNASIHVVPIVHEDIAWDIVLRHLRSFSGDLLLFAFSNSDVYDAGTAEIHYSKIIRQFHYDGRQFPRLSMSQKQTIWEQKAAILDRPLPPKFYQGSTAVQEDAPWVFRIATPTGKIIRAGVWNGRRDYAHELPTDVLRWVGGDKVAVVQVDSPVGVDRRSSLSLTHYLAKDFDGVLHWARDSETFQSILRSFVRLDLESVSPPDLPKDWNPEVVILMANR